MRRALAGDLPGIVRVTNAAYQVEAFCIRGDRLDLAEAERLAAEGFFLVEEAEGDLVASVYLKPEGDRCYLGLLAVDPALQGRGLARRLVEAAEAEAAAGGAVFMDLSVVTLRQELFPFYARLGYHAHGTAPFRSPDKLILPLRLVLFTKCLVEPATL
ncbi:MAG TPA: GNAT family N-acetyltransferase [Holophaga sp.]|nr:GNAT family N-acetyltransferase [Holophaga sp.]